MKVLLCTPVPPDREAPGAIPALLFALLVGLSQRNEVIVATPAGPDPAEMRAVERLRTHGWTVHAVPRHAGPRWSRRVRMAGAWLRGRPWRAVWFHEPAMQSVLHRLIATMPFDLVAVEDDAMATYTLEPGTPAVLTEHEVLRPRSTESADGAPERPPAHFLRERDRRLAHRYQPRAWRRFNLIHVFTDEDAQAARAVAPDIADRFVVAPFGVHIPPAAAATGGDEHSIGFAGNYTHPPNVDAALWLARDILPLVRRHLPAARLVLAGAHAPARLRSLVGPHTGIRLAGVVEDAAAFARSVAVVAAPVRAGGGMRMKVLHAMASGSPVVTTRRGIEGLTVGGAPPVVVADDAGAIADGITRLLRNRDMRIQLGDRARVYAAAHYGPSAYAGRMEAIYAAAIDKHHRGARSRA